MDHIRDPLKSSGQYTVPDLTHNGHIRHLGIQAAIASAGTHPAPGADPDMAQLSWKTVSAAHRLVVDDRHDPGAGSDRYEQHIVTGAMEHQPFIGVDHHIYVISHITGNLKFLFYDLSHRDILPPLKVGVG